MKTKINHYMERREEDSGTEIQNHTFYDAKKLIASFEVIVLRDKSELSKNNVYIMDDTSARYSDSIRAASYAYKKLELIEEDISRGVIAIITESYVLPEYRKRHIFTILLSDIIVPSSGLIVDMYKYGAILVRFIPSNGLSHCPIFELADLDTEKINSEIENNLKNIEKYGWTIIPPGVAKYTNDEFAYKSIKSFKELYEGLTDKDWNESFYDEG